jgi:Protein of unknown function (DUF2510)
MNSMQPGWYPDPFGRFARRYHDGRAWTEHVADQQGTQLSDAAPVSGQLGGPGPGFERPAAPQWQQPAPQPQWSQPAQPTWTQQPAQPAVTTGPGVSAFIGVIVAGVGALFVLLGVLALDWFEDANRSDTSDVIDGINDIGGDPNILSTTFFGFGWIIVLLIALACVGAALMKQPALRFAAAGLAGLAFLWVLFGWLNFNAYIKNDANAAVLGTSGVSLGIGGWLTLLGLAACAVGAAIGGQMGASTSASTPTPARTY